jgi:hypothetical protein
MYFVFPTPWVILLSRVIVGAGASMFPSVLEEAVMAAQTIDRVCTVRYFDCCQFIPATSTSVG